MRTETGAALGCLLAQPCPFKVAFVSVGHGPAGAAVPGHRGRGLARGELPRASSCRKGARAQPRARRGGLTELDMSDQELAEVFADSDDENVASESPAGLHPHPIPRAGYLRSPSWTRTKAEQGREKKHLSDSELQVGIVDTFLTVERPQEED
uniref:Dysbindin domain-containing protein 1 n=1 Tax=Pelodiscus sinensis TaxID=13735 RepID=K7FCQ7_PELSI|nr:dysbindin domain-containing protein 1 [Pelodiscus sinensis]|eukprot:XP_006135675.2 dysbindin domain-containing protein 1 [Pelodiscus sinensis]